MTDYGRALRALRVAKGLSVPELADSAGVHRVALHHLESGARLPAWETACKLAEALDASLDQFRSCDDSEKMERKPVNRVDN